jgi:hypothetical protein
MMLFFQEYCYINRVMSAKRNLPLGQGMATRNDMSVWASSIYTTSDGESIVGMEEEDKSIQEDHISTVGQREECSTTTTSDQVRVRVSWSIKPYQDRKTMGISVHILNHQLNCPFIMIV